MTSGTKKCRVCRGTGLADNNGDMWDFEEWPCEACTPPELLDHVKRLTSERDSLQERLDKAVKT